jgi:predicted PurR-regulated permease PerM
MQIDFTSQRWAGWAIWLGVAAVVATGLWLLAPVLTPFLVAAVLAYALNPLVNRMDLWVGGRMPRVVAVVAVELLFVVVVVGVLLLVVPILMQEVPLMREQVPKLLERLRTTVGPMLVKMGLRLPLDTGSLQSQLLKYLNANWDDLLGSLLSSLKLGGSVALVLVGNAVLIPMVLFYLLLDWPRLVRGMVELVPLPLRSTYDSFMTEADTLLGQYLRGQLLVMLVLAVYYSIFLSLFGLDLAVPIGVFTGLAVCVPYLGFGFGLVLATLSGLLQMGGWHALAMVSVVYGFGQVLESFYLTPRLVGERIGLHPLAVIFALLAFGQWFGFVGVLIALPASAVLLVAMRRLRVGYLSSPLHRGVQPRAVPEHEATHP